MPTITGQVLASLRSAPLVTLAGLDPPAVPGWYVLWASAASFTRVLGAATCRGDPPPFYAGETRNLAAQMERLRLLLWPSAGIDPATVLVQWLPAQLEVPRFCRHYPFGEELQQHHGNPDRK